MAYIALEDSDLLLLETSGRFLIETTVGSASITGASSVTASAQKGISISEAISAGQAVTASSQKGGQDSAVITEGTDFTASGNRTISAAVSVSASASVTYAATTGKQASAQISSVAAVNTLGRRNVQINASPSVSATWSKATSLSAAAISAGVGVSVLAKKAVERQASISAVTGDSASFSFDKQSQPVINANASVNVAASFEITVAVSINANAEVSVETLDLRPPTPINLRGTRTGNSVTLSWTERGQVQDVQIFRSEGQRSGVSLRATVLAGVETYTDSAPADTLVSYQIVARGITSRPSSATQFIYLATPSNIL